MARRRGQRRHGRGVILLPLDQWLAKPLENRFPRSEAPARLDGILVLSAAQQIGISATRGIPVQHFAEGDMVAAAELARRYPQARLVFTGGSASGRDSAADVAHDIFDQLGIDQARVTYERRSRDTFENLRFSFDLVQPKPEQTWIVVAAALHMPRTMAVAQHLPWRLTPWPTDYLTPGGADHSLFGHRLSFSRNLSTVDLALHEWLGLVFYRLTGKTGALFPAP